MMLGRMYLISCCYSWFVFPLFDISKMASVVPLLQFSAEFLLAKAVSGVVSCLGPNDLSVQSRLFV